MAEITDRKSLEEWLQDKPPEVAVAIAARAELRSVPLLIRAADWQTMENRSTRILSSFRAAALARFVGRWPEQSKTVARRARERMRAPDPELLDQIRTTADRLIEASDDDARMLAEEGRAALDRIEHGQPVMEEADKHAIYMLGWMLFRVPRLTAYITRIIAGADALGKLYLATDSSRCVVSAPLSPPPVTGA